MRPRTDRHRRAWLQYISCRLRLNAKCNERKTPSRQAAASRQTDAGAESGVDLFRTRRTTDRRRARVSRSPLSVDARRPSVCRLLVAVLDIAAAGTWRLTAPITDKFLVVVRTAADTRILPMRAVRCSCRSRWHLGVVSCVHRRRRAAIVWRVCSKHDASIDDRHRFLAPALPLRTSPRRPVHFSHFPFSAAAAVCY